MLKMGATNIGATSNINNVDVAYFSASFFDGNGGNYTISKNITNIAAYEENKAQCDADYVEFEEKASELMEYIKSLQTQEQAEAEV